MVVCGFVETFSGRVSADSAANRTSTTAISPANEKTVARLTTVFGCSDRVWPGWQVSSLNLLLVDVARENAILLRGEIATASGGRANPTVTTIPYESVPAYLKGRGLGAAAVPNWPNLGRILAVFHSAANETEIARVVEMALHEGFHLTGQRSFARDGARSFFRGTRYPEDARARYLRHEILIALSRSPAGEPLGAVAYWAKEFSATHGTDDERYIDRIEGSATYVGTLGLSIAQHGCNARDEILNSDARDHLNREWGKWIANPVRPNADTEGTIIGGYAGLRLQLSAHRGWHEAVERGATPLDLLLESVVPVKQADNDELFNRLEATIVPRNAMNKSRLERMGNALQSPLHAIISFPALRLGPASSPQGLLTFDSDGGRKVQVILDLDTSVALGREGGRLTLKGTDIRFETGTPCGSAGQIIFPVKRDAVTQLSDERVNVSDEGVFGRNVRVAVHDRSGVQWMCVRSD